MKSRRFATAILVLLLFAAARTRLSSQDAYAGWPTWLDRPIEVILLPGATETIGAFGPYLGIGITGQIDASFRPWRSPVCFGGAARYSWFGLEQDDGYLQSAVIAPTVGARFRFGPGLRVSAQLGAGAALSVLQIGTASAMEFDAAFLGSVSAGYHVSPLLFLNVGISYHYLGRLYNGFSASVGLGLALGSPGAYFADDLPHPEYTDGSVAVSGLSIDPVFPAYYKYYDTHSLGSLLLSNWSEQTVRDVSVSLAARRYMDVPRTIHGPAELRPGESARINLTALFTDEILLTTANTAVAGELVVSYRVGGREVSYGAEAIVEISNRNAMTWEDDTKVSAFVTSTDPDVVAFARSSVSAVSDKTFQQVNANLRAAVALFESMRLHGIAYVQDPTTPFVVASEQPEYVDYLQFPRETVESRGGDCDDLSICFNALLESVGVASAFVTVPGHIFSAVSTELSADEARREFGNDSDLVEVDGWMWIPVEVTLVQEGFGYAWQQGARLWREYEPSGDADLFSTASGWQTYEGVGLFDTGSRLETPPAIDIADAYIRELRAFVGREIRPRIVELEQRIENDPNNPAYRNQLGTLYARRDLIAEADRAFIKALEIDPEYVPSLVNAGHLAYLDARFDSALSLYLRAQAVAPDNPRVVLAVARAHHELEQYQDLEEAFARLTSLDRDLAEQFSYLDRRSEQIGRASDILRLRSELDWEESE